MEFFQANCNITPKSKNKNKNQISFIIIVFEDLRKENSTIQFNKFLKKFEGEISVLIPQRMVTVIFYIRKNQTFFYINF